MARSGAAAALLVLLAACASQPQRGEVFVAALAGAIAGSYDNLAQSRAGGGHAPLRLVIAPVSAPLVADLAFYVQEMDANDPRRVFSQRLFILNPVGDAEQAVLSQADFSESARWRDGHLNRDLFKSLLPQDLRPRAGCEIILTRAPGGFAGTGGEACRIAAPGTGETLKVEQRLELDADGIAIFERRRDAAGALLAGPESDGWYRYARRADAPW